MEPLDVERKWETFVAEDGEVAIRRKVTLDVAWAAAEAALPKKNPDGTYPRVGRYIVLTGPIAGGVYWAYATLFDGNEAQHERREHREPAGFGPIGEGPAAALQALATRLIESPTEGET